MTELTSDQHTLQDSFIAQSVDQNWHVCFSSDGAEYLVSHRRGCSWGGALLHTWHFGVCFYREDIRWTVCPSSKCCELWERDASRTLLLVLIAHVWLGLETCTRIYNISTPQNMCSVRRVNRDAVLHHYLYSLAGGLPVCIGWRYNNLCSCAFRLHLHAE